MCGRYVSHAPLWPLPHSAKRLTFWTMARHIDARKTRKALRKIQKAALLAEQGLGPELTEWEKEFLETVGARLDTYGSAFQDQEKGALDNPLSLRQQIKLKEIDRKARGKGEPRSGYSSFRKRQAKLPKHPIQQTPPCDAEAEPEAAAKLQIARPSDGPAPAKPSKPVTAPRLYLIRGGGDKA